MRHFILKHRNIVIYFCCSAATAVLESVLGWFFLKLLPAHIVVTNTLAIIIGAVCHYFLTLKLVFRKKSSGMSALIYAATFLLGIVLQDLIIWALYDFFLKELPEGLRYWMSKIASLGLPFFAIYYLRSVLNQKYLGDAEKKIGL
ncbi:MAG: GtrA family protein [Oscillospiraceae bacterium]|jgi:putative flippase GtrA